MKKITLFVLTLCISFMSYAQLSEDFEGATFPPAGWASFIGDNGLGTGVNWASEAFGGTTTAVCVWEILPQATDRSEDWLVTPQITVLASAPTLSFQSIDSGTTEYGSIYTVRVSTTTQNTPADFTIVDTQTEADITHSQTTMLGSEHTVDLSSYIGQAIYIAFVLEQNDGDLWRIDNVELEGPCLETAAPNCVTEISPANNDAAATVGAGGAVSFTWNSDPNAESYELFINGNSQGLRESGITFTGFPYGTPFTWSVVPTNCFGDATGCPEWSFTTETCTDTAVPTTVASTPIPADAATAVPIQAPDGGYAFNWTATANAGESFTLNIGTTNPPTQDIAGVEPGETITGLAVNTTYFWSIDVVNCFGSNPGPVWSFTTDSTLGIEENILNNSFSVYPNPTSNVLNIKSSQDIDNVIIYNLLGQNVASFTKHEITDSSIDMSELSKGLYLVKITSGDKTQTLRVTKE
ncbi:T9SS-dependent choice-of-anchor J family protein [Winogradskyella eximia]|uniref:T9SS-dependent choice-of-anchor J family protein n=1 Tax=Winogradskyella eximia TaxID=262006 RepID=UPI00248FA331|nr:choice-of-anchor J domain-containing protein [Winogradskyella eximia]